MPQGFVVIVDDDDYEMLSRFSWHVRKSPYTTYARHAQLGYMHRVIMGVVKRDVLVDHKNSNGLDNTRVNLRVTDYSGNSANRKLSTGISGYRGVELLPSGRWVARCRYVRLGTFDDPVDAARAYDRAAVVAFGEFATLNFPRS